MANNLLSEEISLFDQLCAISTLRDSFKAVKRNKGAPGIDGVTVDQFDTRLEEELGQLKKELESWTYKPQPVRSVEIPKPNGGTRRLGIPCVRDRVCQAAIKGLLEPLFEPEFSEHSYGFRPGRSQHQAIQAAKGYVEGGKRYVVDIDLEKFFDKIHQDRLISRISERISDKRILRLIGMTLRSGILKDGVVTQSLEGSVQGSPLSPLLSNIVLDELDKAIEQRGLQFCRFADDCNIFTSSLKAAERVMHGITKFIERKLKLTVNKQKSKVALTKDVTFLGFTINLGGDITVSVKSKKRAMDKVKELSPRGTHNSLKVTIEKFNVWYRGWCNYFSVCQAASPFKELEAHFRRRMRARIVVQHKRPQFLFKELTKRGVPKRQAAVVFKNYGPWYLSHTPAMDKGYKNRWFQKQGMLTFSRKTGKCV